MSGLRRGVSGRVRLGEGQLGELEWAEFALLLSLILRAQRSQIVERGFRFGRVRWLRRETLDGEVALAVLDDDRRQAQARAVEVKFDLREVKRIEAEFERPTSQMRLGLLAIGL